MKVNLKEYFDTLLISNNDDREILTEVLSAKTRDIFNYLAESYYDRSYLIDALDGFKNAPTSGIACLISEIFKEIETLVYKQIYDINESDIDFKYDIDLGLQLFKKVVQKNYTRGEVHLMFEKKIDLDGFTKAELSHLFSQTLDYTTNTYMNNELEEDRIDLSTLSLVLEIQKAVADILGLKEKFYYAASCMLQIISIKGLNQEARDLAEQFYISSCNDNMSAWGAYIHFIVYNQQRNVIPATFYATILLKKITLIELLPSLIYKGTIRELAKLFRNAGFFDLSNRINALIKGNPRFNDKERVVFQHIHFSNRLINFNESVKYDLVKYLLSHSDSIYNGGEEETMPWASIIFNVIEMTQNSLCNRYLLQVKNRFESIVEHQRFLPLKRHFESFRGKEYLDDFKRELALIIRSRHESDLVNDTKQIYVQSKRLIKVSYEQQDIEKFLISLLVQSDINLSLLPNERRPITQYVQNKNELLRDLYEIIPDTEQLIQDFPFASNEAVLWIGTSRDAIYTLWYFNNKFSKINKHPIDIEHMVKWAIDEVAYIGLNEYKKDFFGRSIEKSKKDYIIENDSILSYLKSFSIDMNNGIDKKNLKSIYVIKDISLARYPDSLLVFDEEFASEYFSIVTINSLIKSFSRNYNKQYAFKKLFSIWIPIDSGDMTINLLYNLIKDEICKFNNFEIETGLLPDKPLDTAINFIVAHGFPNISEVNVLDLSVAGTVVNLEKVIGIGTIIVAFVCHSGSANRDSYRIKVNSLVYKLMETGYETVIAPIWPLNIVIIKPWMIEFINFIERGYPVGLSVYYANKAVKQIYPYIGAYGCLHAFGNPDVRLNVQSAK